MYVRKWRLLLVLNLTKTIKENKEKKVKGMLHQNIEHFLKNAFMKN